jgi:hypothetical protein
MDASLSGAINTRGNTHFTRLSLACWGCFIQHLAYKTRNNEVEKKEK